jgi:hypothetical protein
MTVQSILKQLFAAYPNVEVADGTVAMYLRLLADIPTEDLQTVVDQCIAELKFLPTIAEIRERHRTLTRTLAAPTWTEAWELLQRAMRECGAANRPTFSSNPVLERAVGIMGWRDMCLSDNLPVIRAQFRDVYNGLVDRTETVDRLLPQARALVDRRTPYGLTAIAALLEARNGN